MTEDQLAALDLDRWTVMRVLRAERFSFPAMIPVLVELGLLECSDEHRVRVRRDNGETVCVTCETNLGNYWRRGLSRLADRYADMAVTEVKGAWFEDHEFIMQMCRENAIGPGRRTTTRTTETVEVIDGKELKTINTVKNVTEFRVINPGLLRLLGEVRDKMARIGGMNVDRPVIGEKAPDVDIYFHELASDGSAGDEPAN